MAVTEDRHSYIKRVAPHHGQDFESRIMRSKREYVQTTSVPLVMIPSMKHSFLRSSMYSTRARSSESSGDLVATLAIAW